LIRQPVAEKGKQRSCSDLKIVAWIGRNDAGCARRSGPITGFINRTRAPARATRHPGGASASAGLRCCNLVCCVATRCAALLHTHLDEVRAAARRRRSRCTAATTQTASAAARACAHEAEPPPKNATKQANKQANRQRDAAERPEGPTGGRVGAHSHLGGRSGARLPLAAVPLARLTAAGGARPAGVLTSTSSTRRM
jgi:hypothetical protein